MSTDGYVFTLNVTPQTPGRASSYSLNSDPQSANTGTNHFYIDSLSAEIHANPNQPASATDPLYDK